VSAINKGQMIGLEEFIIFKPRGKTQPFAITVSTWQLNSFDCYDFSKCKLFLS